MQNPALNTQTAMVKEERLDIVVWDDSKHWDKTSEIIFMKLIKLANDKDWFFQ